jgi:hypothetical protein
MVTYIPSPSYVQYLPELTSSPLPGVRDLFPGMFDPHLCGVGHANAVPDLWALPLSTPSNPPRETTNEYFTPLDVPITSSHGPAPLSPLLGCITQQATSLHLPSYLPSPLSTPDPSPSTRTTPLQDDADAVTNQSQPQPQPLPVSFLCRVLAIPGLTLSLASLDQRRNRGTRTPPHPVRRRSAGHTVNTSFDCDYASAVDLGPESCRTSNMLVASTSTSSASPIASTTVAIPVFYRCALDTTVHGHELQHELQHGRKLGDVDVDVVPQQRDPSEPLACRRCLKRFKLESQLDSHHRTHPAHAHTH